MTAMEVVLIVIVTMLVLEVINGVLQYTLKTLVR